MHLFVRANASPQIGLGHVMRCIALAQAWKRIGGRVTFVSQTLPLSLHARLTELGFGLLSDTLPATEWGGRPGEWLVLDGYEFSIEYQLHLKKSGFRLLLIDDLADLPRYHADIILNQNPLVAPFAYSGSQCPRLLLGSSYILLRPEFEPWHARAISVPPNRVHVLITMGGTDPGRLSLRVADALRDTGLKLVIVTSSANPLAEDLGRAASSRPNLALLLDPPDIPSLMARSLLAVTAGGGTCWELAYTGVPAVIVCVASNQAGIAEFAQRRGFAEILGGVDDASPERILDSVTRLVGSPELRHRMSSAGSQSVDGGGAQRVVRAMREFTCPN